MERESNKLGPRRDEDEKAAVRSLLTGAPTSSRAASHRQEEDLDGPDAVDAGGRRPDVADPADLGPDERDQRAELAARTASARFPATAAELLAAAREDGADEAILGQLQAIDEDRRFENLEDVWTALGGHRGTRS